MPTPRILAVGYLSVDRIDTPGGRHDGVPGGAALYAALGARMAGAHAAIAAAVGDDYPEAWLAALAALGVDVSRVERRPGATRTAHITYSPLGARASPHHDDSGWWERTEALKPCCKGCDEADRIVAGALPFDALLDTVRAANRARVPMVVDTSEAFARRSRDRLLKVIRHVSVFAPSREETRLLMPGRWDDEAAEALARLGPRILQKRGADGAVVVDGMGASLVRIAAPPARVVDPTGAGDATTGALAASMARGDTLASAAAAALHVGAVVVGGIGPAPLGLTTEPPARLARDGRSGA